MAAAEGARVFVISLEERDCERLVAAIGGSGYAAADLTDESAAEAAFARASDSIGAFDGLFAAAGGSGRRFGDGPVHELSLEAWGRTIELNGAPTFLAAREAISNMSSAGGSVVLVSSVLPTRPAPRLFPTHGYTAVKGAVNSLATALAAYYAPKKIRVNVIAPGLVRTPMSERAANDPETVEYAVRKQPLAGGFLEPKAIGDAAVFLLSDESEQITGQIIAVDGGWSVTEA